MKNNYFKPLYTVSLITDLWKKTRRWYEAYWNSGFWHKLTVISVSIILLYVGFMYGVARWYIHTEANKPLVIGVSFIPSYAKSLGLDPKQTLDALIDDAGARHFRLVSYWSQYEPTPGNYDFSQLDWQFKKIEAAGGDVTLSVGLRQPRWPECHMPSWAAGEPESQWEPQLEAFMTKVVNRYKNSPALRSYQVENEYFLKAFGTCQNYDRSRLISEYNLVKKLDPNHPVIVSRSNNAWGWPIGKPTPDEFGISIYKRTWEDKYLHRYIEYPFPAWFYGWLAGWQKITDHRDMIVHELQAEPWTPDGKSLTETSLAVQNESFNADRFRSIVQYGKATGMREMYLWGGEYWYYRKVKLHDDSVWKVAKQTFRQN